MEDLGVCVWQALVLLKQIQRYGSVTLAKFALS